MGYVQQNDVHLHNTAVREALQFSALLKQPKSTSKAGKLAYVEEVLEMMDTTQYEEAIVGLPGEGLNIEQRKCLIIAVEMAPKPELLLYAPNVGTQPIPREVFDGPSGLQVLW